VSATANALSTFDWDQQSRVLLQNIFLVKQCHCVTGIETNGFF
jgi:hypothetical protein